MENPGAGPARGLWVKIGSPQFRRLRYRDQQGLFGIGVGTSLFTGRSAVFSGSRQLMIGLAAAAVTFGIGKLVGVSLGG